MKLLKNGREDVPNHQPHSSVTLPNLFSPTTTLSLTVRFGYRLTERLLVPVWLQVMPTFMGALDKKMSESSP